MALLGAYATPATTVPMLVLGFLLVGGVLVLGRFESRGPEITLRLTGTSLGFRHGFFTPCLVIGPTFVQELDLAGALQLAEGPEGIFQQSLLGLGLVLFARSMT